MATVKKTDNNNCWQECRAPETNTHAFMMQMQSVETDMATSNKGKHSLTRGPSNLTLGFLPKRNENICAHKNLDTNIYSSFLHNNLGLATAQMPINR
jgi:polysaccharide deacetylase 2 family uncharacterized protein YibQ